MSMSHERVKKKGKKVLVTLFLVSPIFLVLFSGLAHLDRPVLISFWYGKLKGSFNFGFR